jgi:hypothetical protein
MQKSKYAKVKIIRAMLRVNMDNYQCYLSVRVWIFKSCEHDFSISFYSSGASVGLRDGDFDGYTSCDGDSDDDDVTFSFYTCLVYGVDFGGVGSSFMGFGNSVQ